MNVAIGMSIQDQIAKGYPATVPEPTELEENGLVHEAKSSLMRASNPKPSVQEESEYRAYRSGRVKRWVVDYDVPLEPHARRRAFYRALHRVLAKYDVEASRSTMSVWILDSKELAEEIHRLACEYGTSNFYE